MGVMKEAQALADRVKARGYDVECDGHAFLVRENGKLLCRFTAATSASFGSIAVARAEADLKRRGILPKDRHEEDPKRVRAMRRKDRQMAGGVPKLQTQERQQLVERISKAMSDRGMTATAFSKEVAEAEPGWKAGAIEQSIRNMKTGANVSIEIGERWNRILDGMNGAVPEPIVVNPVATLDERVQGLEKDVLDLTEMVTEVEKERDTWKEKVDGLRDHLAKANREKSLLERDLAEAKSDLAQVPVVDKVAFAVDLLGLDDVGERILRRLFGG